MADAPASSSCLTTPRSSTSGDAPGMSGCGSENPRYVVERSMRASVGDSGRGDQMLFAHPARVQGDLHDAFTLMAEDLERLIDVIEREPVRHKRGEVDPAAAHHLHEPAHPLLSTRAEGGDDLVIAEAREKRVVRRRDL